MIIGITGGTGCGKTTLLEVIRDQGGLVLDCDAIYHRLLQTDPSLLASIENRFPSTVAEGVLQRKKLGQQVFADPAALETLNRTVWPFVNRAVEAILREQAPRPCAIDAIGLMESGLDKLCTHTVAITAPEETRVARLMAREGIEEAYARLRIRAQKSNEVFAAACGMTIENNDSHAEGFQTRCRAMFQTILKEDPT